jgi:DNA-binding MarR family transcriptional regulator/GNAT superfamily N-acetyltransferase
VGASLRAGSADVDALRRFSRRFTQSIGILTDRYLELGLPVGEARVLFEVGDGVAVRELRSRLDLDAGYLSRTLRALERRHLILLSVHPDDGRARVAELTPTGRDVVAEQNRRAGTAAAAVLDGLDERQRGELIGALESAERLLRLAAVTLDVVDPASEAAKHCLAGFAAELKQRFPEGFDEADFVAADQVRGDAGAFVVASLDGRPIACGAVRTLSPGVGEIRHVWVDVSARGMGLGRRLMGELEREAVERGLRVVRLGTHRTLAEAIAMYRTSGYVEIPPYDDDPHVAHAFEKRLRSRGGGAGAARSGEWS